MTTGKREAIRAPLSRGSLRRSRALQTAESLCRSSAHAAAQLEKRAQHSARDRLRRLPRAVPPPYLGREGQSSGRVPPGGAQPGFTQPLLASRKDTQHISAPCPASQLCLNSASWTREVHKPQPSPHFLPVARRLSRSPKGSLQSLTEMLLLQHLPRGAGIPLPGPISSQSCFGEQVGSGKQHLLEQQVADVFPATSRGVQQEANALPQEHRSGQAVPTSTLECCTYCGGTRVTFSRSKGHLCHL